jgi:hypothetical protein
MTESGVPAGWYDDPHVPGQVRYFDGTGWTEHTSAAPVAAVASPVGAAAFAPASAYAGGPTWPVAAAGSAYSDQYAVVPGGWAPAQGYVTASPGWSSRKRALVLGAAVLVGLLVLGGLIGLTRLGGSRNAASGPALTLTDGTPVTVVGRQAAIGPESSGARTQMLPIITKSFAGLPGSGSPHLEIYGPGSRSAPVRGSGYVVLIWMRVTKTFDQNSFATGMIKGLTQASASATNQTFAEANGGKTVCSQSTPPGADVSMVVCAFIRSATGLVVTIEYDVPVDVVLGDNRAVVASMTHLA